MNPSIPLDRESRTIQLNPSAAFERALALERAGRVREAEQVYRSLLRACPGDPGVLHNLALVMRTQGLLADAESNVRAAIAADGSKAAYHNTLGVILRAQGRWEHAEAAYRQALSLWSGYPEAHFNLGLLLEASHRKSEARDEFREAVRLKPDYAQARGRLVAALQKDGRLGEALQVLEEVSDKAGETFELAYYRGSALSLVRRHEEAIAALESAAAMKPDSLEATLALAGALREAGRLDAALDAYWRALELRPDRLATHDELNRLAWMAGRSDLYLRSFQYVRNKRGADPELLNLEAVFQLRRDGHAQAERLLREARLLAPGRGDIAGLLARAIAGQGRYEEAYSLFVEAIDAEPTVSRHRHELGFALLRDRQPAQALQVFEQALQVSPFDQIVLAGLSLAYRELQDERYHALVDFDRYVRVYDLGGPKGIRDVPRFNEQLAAELQRLHGGKAEPIDQSLRGGTQSTGRLFDERLPAVQQLRERIEAAVQDYIKQTEANPWHPVALRKPAEVRFAGSWSCWLRSGGFHQNHVHPQGWLSSAYYVRLPDATRDPANKAGWLKFGESNLALGVYDTPAHALKPAVGRLILFPSYFWHGTMPFEDRGDRLAVAFDVAAGGAGATMPDVEELRS